MKPVEVLLAELNELDVRLWRDGDRLRINAPKGVLTPDLRAELTARKAEILTFLDQKPPVAGSARPPIRPVSRAGTLPLSFAQERLWFLSQLNPDSVGYNSPNAMRLIGPLDAAVLVRSLNEIVRRHEALRTTFTTTDGQPAQVIAPYLAIPVPVVDLREVPDGERETEARWLATEETRRPFDLTTGPLLRAGLYRLADDEHILLLVMHHIVSDGWSMTVFWRELSALYGSFCAGRPSPLPDLPIQYADFAVWQREALDGKGLKAQLVYWEGQLAGASPLALPTDHPRPRGQTYNGARHPLSLPKGLAAALKDLSRQEGVTLYMTLLAAFQVMLYRYTGQEDVVVGSPIANRNQVEIEGLIGFFVNMLVMRAYPAGQLTFRGWLGQVREMCLGAYVHQDLPFEKLVEVLRPERDPSRPPFFQVTFALQNAREKPLGLEGLQVSVVSLNSETVRFDLECHLWEAEEGLVGNLVYNTDLFEEETIARMAGHYRRLLEAAVADPDRHLSELALLTDEERQRMLVEWNETRTDYPREAGLHRLFEAWAEQTPEAVAVIWGEQELSYAQLNERANRLARHLRGLGVRADVLVGLCVDRSVEMVVGMLGILKAGGAYVPLDPEYPRERLAFMLADTRAGVVLTQERLLGVVPDSEAQVVCLDRDWPDIAGRSGENVENEAGATDLAYVIYTSGSTGKPKGVAVGQRAVSRLVCQTDYVRLGPGDRVAQASTSTFDAATFEVWGALLNGACLVGLPTEVLVSPPDFAAYLRQQPVDVLFVTTALFNQLAAAVPEAFGSLRELLFGGERVEPRWVREVLEKGRPGRLLHVYGPTESTTFATWYAVEEVDGGAATVPIGRSVANTRLYVLDKEMQPVPVGVCGELYIGGDGLARGYLQRPEQTAAQFVPGPFSGEAGTRLYRSGDLVRYLPDGNIEFVGRVDEQVKVRGYRIELGEIEAALGQHAGVREAVVVVRDAEREPGDKRLVGYVVAAGQAGPSTGELRRFLKEKLPGYMVPAAFVMLEALPLTASGKVDRQRLPRPEPASLHSGEAAVAHRDAVELQLARIWESLLGLEGIGPGDNFFELGGHSLLAMRLFVQIEQTFGAKLPVSTIFRCPTVEQLAAAIRQDGARADWPTLVTIQPGGCRPPFFCVPNLEGTVLAYADLARLLGPDQPVYGFQAKGLNGTDAPYSCLEDMAAHYIKAMQSVQPSGPYYLGGYCSAGVVAFEMARQLDMQGEQVALLALLDAAAPSRSEQRARLWQPTVAMSFVRNLPAWLRDNLPGRYDEVLKRVRLRARAALATRWRRLAYGSDAPQARVTLDEFLGNTSRIPERYRRVMNAHFQARQEYVPQVYRGRVTLFRAQALPLLRPSDPELGWGQLAAGGVEVKVVAGAHHNFLEGSQVEDLAAQLKLSLEQARSVDHRDRGPSPQSRT